nr:MAG TPA: hypothetical protein [Bacteriophage sp.]
MVSSSIETYLYLHVILIILVKFRRSDLLSYCPNSLENLFT